MASLALARPRQRLRRYYFLRQQACGRPLSHCIVGLDLDHYCEFHHARHRPRLRRHGHILLFDLELDLYPNPGSHHALWPSCYHHRHLHRALTPLSCSASVRC